MPKKKFVLLDFDGVLADSQQVAHEVAYLMCKEITPEVHLRQFEGNIYDAEGATRASSHGPECRHDLDWFAEYGSRFHRVQPFAQMIEVLQALSKRYTIVVISSTMTDIIQSFLRLHGVEDCVSNVLGKDVHTKKTEKIRMVFSQYAVAKSDCVFVTDTLGDIREAREVDVDAIAVTWGFHDKERLEKGKPFRIVEMPQELLNAVDDYFARSS